MLEHSWTQHQVEIRLGPNFGWAGSGGICLCAGERLVNKICLCDVSHLHQGVLQWLAFRCLILTWKTFWPSPWQFVDPSGPSQKDLVDTAKGNCSDVDDLLQRSFFWRPVRGAEGSSERSGKTLVRQGDSHMLTSAPRLGCQEVMAGRRAETISQMTLLFYI